MTKHPDSQPDPNTRAEHLVTLATDFAKTGSVEAAKKFGEEWHSIVGAGPTYRDQVEHAAERITNSSWSPFVPDAQINTSGPNQFISFSSTIKSELLGSKAGDIIASNDGSVDAMLPPNSKPGSPIHIYKSDDHGRQVLN